MKRVSVILLVLILASTSFGCAAQENKKKNDVFTDAFASLPGGSLFFVLYHDKAKMSSIKKPILRRGR